MIEDPVIAKKILDVLHVVSGELDTSIATVRDTCPNEEFIAYRRAIAKVMGEMFFEIVGPLYREHPALTPPVFFDEEQPGSGH